MKAPLGQKERERQTESKRESQFLHVHASVCVYVSCQSDTFAAKLVVKVRVCFGLLDCSISQVSARVTSKWPALHSL